MLFLEIKVYGDPEGTNNIVGNVTKVMLFSCNCLVGVWVGVWKIQEKTGRQVVAWLDGSEWLRMDGWMDSWVDRWAHKSAEKRTGEKIKD